MSKLGTIYEINYKENRKELYPIVYENQELYVCKVHGCSEVKIFRKYGGHPFTYSAFKDFTKTEDFNIKQTYYVKVDAKEPNEFSELCTFGYQYLKLEELQRKRSKIEVAIDDYEDRIKTLKGWIEDLQYQKKELDGYIIELSKEIANLRCEDNI